MSNEELVLLIQGGENDRMWELYKQNKGLIAKIAHKYQAYGEMEDLMQEGYIGLSDAVPLWDPNGGAAFSTFTIPYIRNAMQRYIENCGSVLRIPSHKHELIRKYKRIVNVYLRDNGRKPEPKILAALLGVTIDQVHGIEKDIISMSLRSMEEPISDEDGELVLGDTVADPTDQIGDLIEDIQHKQLSGILWKIVDDLPAQEKAVIHGKYRNGETVRACSKRLNMTDSQVRGAETKALKEMRQAHNMNRLRPFYDFIGSAPYRCTGLRYFKQTHTSAPERIAMLLETRAAK